MGTSLRCFSLAMLAGLVGACSDDPAPTGDAGPDVSVEDTGVETPCTRTFTLEEGSRTGHAQPLSVAAGQARAGRLGAGQLPADRTGLGTAREGDFVLANSRLAVLIEDAGPSDLYEPWGGKLVGVARVRDGRLVDAADFNEGSFMLGRYSVATTSVTVLRDGSDGGPAVVRALGPLRAIPFIKDFARLLAPFEYDDLQAAIDYELRPDADYVDVSMTFNVTRATAVRVPTALHTFFQAYRMPRFATGIGFAVPSDGTTFPYLAFIDDRGMSYAWQSVDSPLSGFISTSGFDSLRSEAFTIPACAQTRRPVARVTVGGPGVDGLVHALARSTSAAVREVTGTVVNASGMPAEGVHVHATDTAGTRYLTRATTDATGAFTLHLPPDQAARLTAFREGDAVPDPVTVAATETTARIQLRPAGAIHVTATEDGSGLPLPVRVQVFPESGSPPSVPASYGERVAGGGRLSVAFPPTGDVTLRAPVGRWRVVVSRGFEYELQTTTVSVADGMTANVTASLRRSVDTAGVQCGDFHIHTHRSPDSSDDARFKVASAVGDGLEVPVRSEHEFVSDFEPLIAELGLSRWAFGVGSIELTTFTWGHFGVVPLTAQPSMINQGSFNWVERRPPEVFDEARARADQPTVIINHPRGAAAGAYFTAAGYDPDAGTASRADFWDTRFTAVEVFNDSSFEQNRAATVRDWFSFLDRGRRVFAVGSSDSHNINPSSPVGYPRTCMFLGTDDPRALTPSRIRDAVAQGRSTISGGIYVTASVGDAGPGQDARGTGAMASVMVTVQAPTWVDATRLEVLVDGRTQETLTLDSSTRDPANPTVRFRRAVSVPVAASGSYVIFAARGDRDLSPVHPNRQSFGVTNPIFLQR